MRNIYKLFTMMILVFSIVISSTEVLAGSAFPLYTDVDENHWAYEAIRYATKARCFSGYEDGSFQPNNTITRAEAVKVIVSILCRDKVNNKSSFVDVDGSEWYAPYVEAGKDLFPFTLESDYFRPTELVTREDTVYALIRSFELTNKVDYVDIDCLGRFADAGKISNETMPYLAVALQLSIISGYSDNTIKAEKALTRAEFATLLYRSKQLYSV